MRALKFAKYALILVVLWSLAWSAAACPVCYGDSDSPIIRGAELSILFMAVLVYAIIFGGFVTFLILRRRSRLARQTSVS